MKKFRLLSIIFIIILSIVSFSFFNCTAKKAAKDRKSLVVASKVYKEGVLLGKIIIVMLRENGFNVVDKTSLGDTETLRAALINGEIDIYPEYTGTAGQFFKEVDPSIWKDSQKGYETAKRLDKEKNNIVWLEPASADNTWVIAIEKDLADKEDLNTLDDFAKYVSNGGYIEIACTPEFTTRPDALPGFQEGYGFELTEDQLLILSEDNSAQKEAVIGKDFNGIMTYGTDGKISAWNLVSLEDTKKIPPIFRPTPIIRAEVLKIYPEIATILEPVFKSLDMNTLQVLNARMAIDGIEASQVVEDYLRSKRLIESN